MVVTGEGFGASVAAQNIGDPGISISTPTFDVLVGEAGSRKPMPTVGRVALIAVENGCRGILVPIRSVSFDTP